ncbi:MAG TPA: hypothetical protein VFS79_15495 [Arthrobacter sp.]|nr:hypothetical protein [Arthrobacter sp.]
MADAGPAGGHQRDPAVLSLDELPDKGRVVCQGRIESVTYLPADQAPAFSAIVSGAEPGRSLSGRAEPGGSTSAQAGSHGRLRVVWLGRRRVPGIEAGAELRLEGMLSRSQGLPTMFNPRYEILSRQENE